MTVEYYKGTACPILLSDKKSAVALTIDSAKKLQADLAKVIERAEKEPKLNDWELSLYSILYVGCDPYSDTGIEQFKDDADMILSLAKQQLLQSDELMTQEHHEKLMETLREECKKDLPRWRIWRNGACGNSEGHAIALVHGAGGIYFVSCLGANGEKYIMLEDLKKLPGFNDVYHE